MQYWVVIRGVWMLFYRDRATSNRDNVRWFLSFLFLSLNVDSLPSPEDSFVRPWPCGLAVRGLGRGNEESARGTLERALPVVPARLPTPLSTSPPLGRCRLVEWAELGARNMSATLKTRVWRAQLRRILRKSWIWNYIELCLFIKGALCQFL